MKTELEDPDLTGFSGNVATAPRRRLSGLNHDM